MTVPPSFSTAKGHVLIAGATGFIGQFIVEASLDSGRQTYVLVRSSSSSCPTKSRFLKGIQDKGAIIVHGVVNDKEGMEKILKEHEIEIVISAVGGGNILDQISLINAIKSVGTVKRFLPSEFGHDVNRADPVEPGRNMYDQKRKVRQLIEESGIPHTYICCNSIASWPYYDNTHPSEVLPPLDKFQIYGDGHVKAYFVAGTDIGKYTMKAIDDFRTVNKSVHFRPPANCLNMNELATLWENKIGISLPREIISEDDLLAAAAENCIPQSIVASFTHDIFIKGCQINFSIDGPDDLEASSLYPDEQFRTIDACFEDYIVKMDKKSPAKDEITTNNPVVELIPITAMCA